MARALIISIFSDIDECSSSPCSNGATCSDQVNGYTCTCVSGWQGTHCDQGTDIIRAYPCSLVISSTSQYSYNE